MTSSDRFQFDAVEIASLLTELDSRLKARRVAASIFVVGGAAIAATADDDSIRRTEDIDAITHDAVVMEEAAMMAAERGLPPNWLNGSARMWMPPLPAKALPISRTSGLHVTYASDEFLLATKLIAQRSKDAGDVRLLVGRLGLDAPTAEQLEAIIRRYYTDSGALELILDGNDVDREIGLLAQRAARMLEAG